MFGIFTITALLEVLMVTPCLYILLQLVMPQSVAFILSFVLNLVVLTAVFICKFKPGPFIYKLITVILSALIAFLTAGLSLGGFIILVVCIIIFSRIRTDLATGRDIAVQLATAAIIINIPLAILFYYTGLASIAFYGNITLCISTVASIIVLVMKQVDDSRRFGKNSMDVSSTQRKNNQVFAGVILVLLLLLGSFGQITSIYRFVLSLIGRFLGLIASLLSPKDSASPAPQAQMQELFEAAGVEDPSLLDKIFTVIIYAIGALILIAFTVMVIYSVFRFLVKMVLRLIEWLKSGEERVDTISENGHTDEKESLLNRNLKNMADRFRNMASGIFNREVPYDKLPDDISKVRRLLKYFISKARANGVKVTASSTAREICRDAGGISLGTEQLNALLADCYEKARYDNTAPVPEQLGQLEKELLKH